MIKGILFQIVAAFLFTLMGAFVRYLGETVPVGQMVFARGIFGLIPLVIWLMATRQLGVALRTDNPGAHFLRAFIGIVSLALVFMGLQLLPLPDATAISYASPLFTIILAVFVLGERVGIYRWTAVFVGFFGVLVILWPHLEHGGLAAVIRGDESGGLARGAIYAFVATFFTAGAMIQVRRLTKIAATATIVFYFSLYSGLLALVTLPFGWVWPDVETGVVLFLIGAVGGVGQIFLTESYRHADASLVAPFVYTSMLWATLIGWLFFNEVPGLYVLAGSAIVIGSGIYLIYRERQLGIKRARMRKAGPPAV